MFTDLEQDIRFEQSLKKIKMKKKKIFPHFELLYYSLAPPTRLLSGISVWGDNFGA